MRTRDLPTCPSAASVCTAVYMCRVFFFCWLGCCPLLYVCTSCVSRDPVSYIVSAYLVSFCLLVRQQHGSWERIRRAPRPQPDGGVAHRAMLPDHATKSIAKESTTGSLPPAVPLAITPTFSPWTHTSDDSYIYQLSLVLATATVSFL